MLILSALNLFGEQGISPITLRMINRAAGAKNNSAANYYFGDKDGLIEAILIFIQSWFEDARADSIQRLEKSNQNGRVSISDVLNVFAQPYLTLIQQEEWGGDAIAFIARIQFEHENHVGRNLHVKVSKSVVGRFRKLILQALPDLPPSIVTYRFGQSTRSFLQGLAELRVFSDMSRTRYHSMISEYFSMYLDYAVAAMEGPNSLPKPPSEYEILGVDPML